MSLRNNLEAVRARIRNACTAAGRHEGAVRLLLATKLQPPAILLESVSLGSTLFGENKVQEALPKAEALRDENITWHFIGHLQSNKVRDVLRFASCIESVDRLSLATALDKELQHLGRAIDVFVEINTSGESSKHGVHPQEVHNLLLSLKGLETLRVRGLMTIGALSDDDATVRSCFSMLRTIRDREIEAGSLDSNATELSMGMSSDLELAIAEGATIVRVGSAVFGSRG
ncbi:MAG: YggS family pyridoxal phosphate-dependent enzyme [bacterium]|nr:YggS family pyridoxal phosphate-dependent enzyme [bacterium]